MRGVKAEDVEEFTQFVHGRSPALLRTAFLLTSGDAHAAEDLLQAALLQTLRHWRSIRDRQSLERFVRQVMVNERRSWFRRRASSELVRDLRSETSQHDPASARALQQVDDGNVLGPALASLPRRQRVVVVLRYFDDLPEHEVALIMGCSVGTVKSQTSKALAKLRLALAPASREEHAT